jgi:hypothetical protein
VVQGLQLKYKLVSTVANVDIFAIVKLAENPPGIEEPLLA